LHLYAEILGGDKAEVWVRANAPVDCPLPQHRTAHVYCFADFNEVLIDVFNLDDSPIIFITILEIKISTCHKGSEVFESRLLMTKMKLISA